MSTKKQCKFYVADIIQAIKKRIFHEEQEAIFLQSDKGETIIPITNKHMQKLLEDLLKKHLSGAIHDIIKNRSPGEKQVLNKIKIYKLLTINVHPPENKQYFNPSTNEKEDKIISKINASLSKNFVESIRELV